MQWLVAEAPRQHVLLFGYQEIIVLTLWSFLIKEAVGVTKHWQRVHPGALRVWGMEIVCHGSLGVGQYSHGRQGLVASKPSASRRAMQRTMVVEMKILQAVLRVQTQRSGMTGRVV